MAASLHENLTKIVGIGTACCTVIGGCWTAFSYISEIKTRFESSQERILSLETSNKDLKSQVAEFQKSGGGGRGPKGERGEPGQKGEPGPQGSVGPAGESGPSRAEVQKIVEALVAQKMQTVRLGSADAAAVPVANTAPAVAKGCIPKTVLNTATVISIRAGTEFCESDGELLTKVVSIDPMSISFHNPGTGNWACWHGSTCEFRWSRERMFYHERSTTDESGRTVAQIRIKPKA